MLPGGFDKTGKADDSIDAILLRRSRQEIVERAGPGVQRYLPAEDPSAFLLPDSRLEPEERKWQKIFVALPWLTFAVMLTVPFFLVRSQLPWIQEQAEEERRRAAERQAAGEPARRVPDFTVVNFGQMPDVLESPVPTIVMLYDPSTYASQLLLPALRDLSAALRAAEINVAVAALDLSASPAPPDDFLWEYPRALAPHFQLVVPRAREGEAGVVDYDGRWSAHGLAEAARRLAGPYAPAVPPEEVARIERGLDRLRDVLFDVYFVEGTESKALSKGGAGFLRRLFGRGDTVADPAGAPEAMAVATAAAALSEGLSGGLEAAIAACEAEMRRHRVAAA